MPSSRMLSYVCLRCTLPLDYLGVGFYGSIVCSASIFPGLNTEVDLAFVLGTLFQSGLPPSSLALGPKRGVKPRGSSFSLGWGHFSIASGRVSSTGSNFC